jgi:hypothetical protein
MARTINFLQFDDKVKNLSIPLDDVKTLRETLSDKEFNQFVGAYITFQLTGDDDCYQGKQKALWNLMTTQKKKYFFKKYLKKTESVEEEVEEHGLLTGSTNINNMSKEEQDAYNNALRQTLN